MATRVLNSRIKIGAFKPFNAVNEVSITKTINNTLETATIRLPASAVLKSNTTKATTYKRIDTNHTFKRGDKVIIELGYNSNYRVEFEGFISIVSKSIPCVLECEGYAFQLRDRQIKKIYRNISSKSILFDLIAGTDIELHPDNEEVHIDKLDVLPQSCFNALGLIKKQLADAVNIWFEGKYLRFGLKYLTLTEQNKNNKPDVVLKTGWNYPREGTLKERLAGDKAYEIQIVTKDEKGKEQKVTAGVTNSNVERKKITAIQSAIEKERLAKAILGSKDYTGVDGSVTTFLEPYATPGHKVQILDLRYTELSGNYLCEEVITTYGRSGARRQLKLTYKL